MTAEGNRERRRPGLGVVEGRAPRRQPSLRRLVLAHHLAGEPLDAIGQGGQAKRAQEGRSHTLAPPELAYRDRHFGRRRVVAQADIAGHPDERPGIRTIGRQGDQGLVVAVVDVDHPPQQRRAEPRHGREEPEPAAGRIEPLEAGGRQRSIVGTDRADANLLAPGEHDHASGPLRHGNDVTFGPRPMGRVWGVTLVARRPALRAALVTLSPYLNRSNRGYPIIRPTATAAVSRATARSSAMPSTGLVRVGDTEASSPRSSAMASIR